MAVRGEGDSRTAPTAVWRMTPCHRGRRSCSAPTLPPVTAVEVFADHHHGASRVARDAFRDAAGSLFVAYLVGAGFMIFAAIIELVLGIRAEGESLENVATPLTAIEEAKGTSAAASNA